MDKRERAIKIVGILEKRYPNPRTKLKWETPWELLVATILAAQCTDDRVNKVTPLFFKKWPTIESLAKADNEEVEEVIRSTGFFRNKAKNLIGAAKKIMSDYNGKVPSSMEKLLSLPGVARKTANIVLSNCFSINEGIAVDTHVKRLSYRLGLTDSKNPNVIEKDLMGIFPKNKWHLINHLFVWYGRDVCRARTPLCDKCEIRKFCPQKDVKK